MRLNKEMIEAVVKANYKKLAIVNQVEILIMILVEAFTGWFWGLLIVIALVMEWVWMRRVAVGDWNFGGDDYTEAA